jgi:hypothetical protein
LVTAQPFAGQQKQYERDNQSGQEEQKYDYRSVHGYLLSLSCLHYTSTQWRCKFGSPPILDEEHTHLSAPAPVDFAPRIFAADGEIAPCLYPAKNKKSPRISAEG